MTHLCCSHCRIRFRRIQVGEPGGCPECGAPLTDVPAQQLVGFRLHDDRSEREWLVSFLAGRLGVDGPVDAR